MCRHQRYLDGDLEFIRTEWSRGTPVRQIASTLDRDPNALASKIFSMRLPKRLKRYGRSGGSAASENLPRRAVPGSPRS